MRQRRSIGSRCWSRSRPCAEGQAGDTLRLTELRSAAEAEAGVPIERRGRGLSEEVAPARRVSGNAGLRHLGFARAVGEMPTTFARLHDRTPAQVMADTLVRRLTGVAVPGAVPLAVDVVVSGDVLTRVSDAAAEVPGYAPIPADIARGLIADALDHDAAVTLRRLFAQPESGALVAMESTARIFPTGLRRFITRSDISCRMPFCDAPIAEIDHAHPHVDGGPTDSVNGNGNGLRRTHSRQKENPGWAVTTSIDDDGTREALIRTPTGHEHCSRAPASPGQAA